MKKTSIALMATLFATPAIAEIELSVLFGSADQEVTTDDFTSTSNNITSTLSIPVLSGDDDSIGIRIGFPINDHLTIEGSYQDFGEIKTRYTATSTSNSGLPDVHINATADFDTTAVAIGAKGILPISDSISLIGRLGLSRWEIDVTQTIEGTSGIASSSDDGTDIYYGVGAEFNINTTMFVGLEYSVLEFDFFNAEQKIENIALSIGAKF
jgi:opacity protein-like surface antigen